MFLRVLLLLVLCGALSCGVAIVVVLELWMYGIIGPAPLYVTAFLSAVVSLVLLLLIARRLRQPCDAEGEQSRVSKPVFALSLAIPALVAGGGAIALIANTGDAWLPSAPEQTVERLPAADNLVIFRGADKLLLCDVDTGTITAWQPRATSELPDVLSARHFIIGQKIVGASGKEFAFGLPEGTYARNPSLSVDGSRLAFDVQSMKNEEAGIWILSFEDDGQLSRYAPYGWGPIWLAGGRELLFCDGRGLIKSRTADSLEVLLADPVAEVRAADPEVSPDGESVVLVFQSHRHGVRGQDRLFSVKLDGSDPTELFVSEPGGELARPHWSPDGRRIGFRLTDPSRRKTAVTTLMVIDRDGANPARLMTLEKGVLLTPAGVQQFAWAPDGKRIAFVAALKGASFLRNEGGTVHHRFDLYVINADGSGLSRLTKLKQEFRSGNSHPVFWAALTDSEKKKETE